MTKAEAVALFGGRPTDLAHALGMTPQAIYQWPAELDQKTTDRVVGAAVRLGKLRTPDCDSEVVSACRQS